ncbi:PorP/SprF family type IX secretion system membrane protein [Ferruginibacter sp. HRS2-29]|uniref:PorP/SprF family type IX secretion system membrane protein n=4 Tax=Ferruginibacter sp. HRS2-29 TaxID=2487334 RepID=UPI0020CF08DE|nr:PorP/SprF family type IX secretion system membrane protein [Ferruginibacter sp. HRS2-29]MCP9750934.1 type IX secretion system membrane protein PorP/SprF [Ferruginibacter sp. HRS2-29]
MKKLYSLLATLAFTALLAPAAKCQVDPHTSQYYMYPLYLNPAMAGLINGDYRVAATYRNQWASITDAFSTTGLTADINTDKNMNFGVNILNQSAGDAGYNYLTGYASLAYTGLRFGKGEYQRISLGMQVGFINRRVNASKFKFGDQWNPITGYNPGNATGDVLKTSNVSSFDAGAGAFYYDATPDKKVNFYGGVAVFHLTKPKDPFLVSGDGAVIPMRYSVHAGANVKLSSSVSMVPNVLYMKQGTAEEKMAGAYFQLKASDQVDVLAGANYRFDDAVTPFAGITYNGLTLGLSYDANTSKLGNQVKNANSFEFTLSFIKKNPAKVEKGYLQCGRL